MIRLTNGQQIEKIKGDLERALDEMTLAGELDLVEAVRGLQSGIDYRDWTIVESRLQEIGHAFAGLATQRIEFSARVMQDIREVCAEVLSINGPIDAELDTVGRRLEVLFDAHLQSLASLESKIVHFVVSTGNAVSNAEKLKSMIQESRTLRESVLSNWPWTSRQPPVVDRNMIAASRREIASSGGEPIGDVISRLSGSIPTE